MFSLTFLRLFEDFPNAVKSFSLFLSQVETVLFGTRYFSATFLLELLEMPVSKSLKAKKRGEKIQTLFEHSNLKIRTKVQDNERKTV